MGIEAVIWLLYAIGVMVALLLFSDDAYEESWKLGIDPEDYLSREEVLTKIITFSIGSWAAILYRWYKKR